MATSEPAKDAPEAAPLGSRWPSVNAHVRPRVDALLQDAQALRIGIARSDDGAVLVDAGIEHRGGLEAGRRIAEICLAGLGRVELANARAGASVGVFVHACDPVLACLASQYAGWSLVHGEGPDAFRALASGPGRALGAREPLFAELGYRDRFDSACLVLEVDRPPPPAILAKIARDCGVATERLVLILTPTRSLAGVVQIVARVLEVALHKVHALGFPLAAVVDGAGSAPLPPPSRDFVAGMGRTNDAILFGGDVQLYVDCDDRAAGALAERLPSTASRDYGKPFAQVFAEYGYDFYRIDPLLFAPAQVTVSNVASGHSFRAGRIDTALLARSFGAGDG
jgi:methenyltetrahydromethanopterin cyclohydrolase